MTLTEILNGETKKRFFRISPESRLAAGGQDLEGPFSLTLKLIGWIDHF
jgi:hypothetical protein